MILGFFLGSFYPNSKIIKPIFRKVIGWNRVSESYNMTWTVTDGQLSNKSINHQAMLIIK